MVLTYLIMSGKKNRNKGHRLEREVNHFCRDVLGYKRSKTSRHASRFLDALEIDIAMQGPMLENIPYLFQCKNGYNS